MAHTRATSLTPRTDALTQAGLNLIQQALTIYNSDLQLAVCNQRFSEMFDLPPIYSTPGASFQDTLRHLVSRGEYGEVGDIDDFIAARVEQARAFEPHYMERTRANGRTISVEGAPLPQGGWVTVYTDISAEKAQEELLRARSEVLSDQVLARSEELAATNRQLAASIKATEEAQRATAAMEARTRLTTEMMPAHIAHVDVDGRYTFSNRQLNAVMPGRPDQIIGDRIKDVLGAQAYGRIAPHLELAQNGDQSLFEFTDELSSRRIRAVFTPDHVNGGVYILSLDVTEETQARAALQQTVRREMAAQLTSGLAHDFSNLLTIILGMQSKLQRMELPTEADALITATLQAARRGGTLLNKIADITSARSYRAEPTDMQRFLADLQTLAGPTLPKDVRLHIHTQITQLMLVDAGMLQDTALNLILNARDACKDRGDIHLELHAVKDTWLELSVSDTGPGFTTEALENGLAPFFTTKGGEGSGLGLAMVYDMVKLAGGTVRLSNTDTGALVSLRLPLRAATLPEKPGLVLLVEDSPDLRVTIRDMLIGLGHTVIEAASVDEALTLSKTVPGIGLVLSDITLEGTKTGLDIAGKITDIPVRLMTSLPVSDPLHAAAIARAPVLQKPFAMAQLAKFLDIRTVSE